MGTDAGRSARWGARWQRHRPRLVDLALSAVTALAAVVDVVDAANNERLGAGAWVGAGLTAVFALAVWWRRRAPLLLAVAGCAAGALGASQVVLAATLATLAVRRRDRVLLAVAGAAVAAHAVRSWSVNPSATVAQRITGEVFLAAVVVGLPVTFGAFVGARRELVASLRERAERAEAEQVLRAEQARAGERARIAREMHDVLGHRISLVVLHAGGLEISATSEEGARSAALIRTVARQALQDLRDVLGVLRTGPDGGAGATPGGGEGHQGHARTDDLAPQRTLDDVAELVSASQRAGVRVRLVQQVPTEPAVPTLLGRTAYRVVQEALTNVHKHAPGAATTVRVASTHGEDLVVEIVNARPVALTGAPAPAGSGLGLVGLHERVHLAHGRLDAGPDPDGGFAVRAHLPWPAKSRDPHG